MLAYGKLSRDMMAHGKGGDYIGLEFSGHVSHFFQAPTVADILMSVESGKKSGKLFT